MDFSVFLQPESYVAILTLTFLEIVLGIDNIIFISIVTNKLPEAQQEPARKIGLGLAMIMRVAMLFGITWIIGFTKPLFQLDIGPLQQAVSLRDLILLVGGIFLIAKSTVEIHHKIEGASESQQSVAKVTMASALFQIVMLDLIFSFDSILTAIGMTDEIALMVVAVVVAILVMMIFAGAVSRFIEKHPTLQVLALSFLILIGFMLTLEGFHKEIEKGYIYFAVFFSLAVELVNMRMKSARRKAQS